MSASRAARRGVVGSSLAVVALSGLLARGTGGGGASPSQEARPLDRGAQADPTQKPPIPPAVPPVLAVEKGKFRIVVDGQRVGTEEFEITPSGKDWLARGSTEIRPSGAPTAQVSSRLTLQPDGTPIHYEWMAEGQKKASAAVSFQGGTAKIALHIENAQPFIQELAFGSPHILVLDNNVYHHYAILARLYDWNAKGSQTFPVLIPQDMTPGSITVEDAGPENVDGATFELLRARTPDLELNLYLDGNHRLIRLSAPASKAEVRRE